MTISDLFQAATAVSSGPGVWALIAGLAVVLVIASLEAGIRYTRWQGDRARRAAGVVHWIEADRIVVADRSRPDAATRVSWPTSCCGVMTWEVAADRLTFVPELATCPSMPQRQRRWGRR